MTANSIISDWIWLKSKLIQAFIIVLISCKNEEDPSKMNALEWSQHFSHYKALEFFPDAQGQLTLIWQNFEPIQDFMVVFVICKIEQDPIKNKGARVVTR